MTTRIPKAGEVRPIVAAIETSWNLEGILAALESSLASPEIDAVLLKRTFTSSPDVVNRQVAADERVRKIQESGERFHRALGRGEECEVKNFQLVSKVSAKQAEWIDEFLPWLYSELQTYFGQTAWSDLKAKLAEDDQVASRYLNKMLIELRRGEVNRAFGPIPGHAHPACYVAARKAGHDWDTLVALAALQPRGRRAKAPAGEEYDYRQELISIVLRAISSLNAYRRRRGAPDAEPLHRLRVSLALRMQTLPILRWPEGREEPSERTISKTVANATADAVMVACKVLRDAGSTQYRDRLVRSSRPLSNGKSG